MIDEIKAKEALENGYEEAEEILEDIDKVERLLQRAEKKLKVVPVVGTQLAAVVTLWGIHLQPDCANREWM